MPQNFYDLLAVMEELSFTTLKHLEEYEGNILNKVDLKKNFHNIDFVYMHIIILNLAKLLSVTNSDKSGLAQLEKFASPALKQEIFLFRNKYQHVINKIASNRNRIISHIDISDLKAYYKMGFSEVEIEKKIEDRKKYLRIIGQKENKNDTDFYEHLRKLIALSEDNERYSPSDFVDAFPLFKSMINEILKLTRDVNQSNYK